MTSGDYLSTRNDDSSRLFITEALAADVQKEPLSGGGGEMRVSLRLRPIGQEPKAEETRRS
jgi:hypothetical protein